MVKLGMQAGPTASIPRATPYTVKHFTNYNTNFINIWVREIGFGLLRTPSGPHSPNTLYTRQQLRPLHPLQTTKIRLPFLSLWPPPPNQNPPKPPLNFYFFKACSSTNRRGPRVHKVKKATNQRRDGSLGNCLFFPLKFIADISSSLSLSAELMWHVSSSYSIWQTVRSTDGHDFLTRGYGPVGLFR